MSYLDDSQLLFLSRAQQKFVDVTLSLVRKGNQELDTTKEAQLQALLYAAMDLLSDRYPSTAEERMRIISSVTHRCNLKTYGYIACDCGDEGESSGNGIVNQDLAPHNSLPGIQGGLPNQRNHLSNAQVDLLDSIPTLLGFLNMQTRWVSGAETMVVLIGGVYVALIQPGKWLIDGIAYQTTGITSIQLAPVESGLVRIDLLVGNANGTITLVQGDPDTGPAAVKPTIPNTQVELRFLTILSDSVTPGQDPYSHVQNTDTGGLLNNGVFISFQALYDQATGGGSSSTNRVVSGGTFSRDSDYPGDDYAYVLDPTQWIIGGVTHELLEADDRTFVVSPASTGKVRRDKVVLLDDGTFSVVPGIEADNTAYPPATPAGTLALSQDVFVTDATSNPDSSGIPIKVKNALNGEITDVSDFLAAIANQVSINGNTRDENLLKILSYFRDYAGQSWELYEDPDTGETKIQLVLDGVIGGGGMAVYKQEWVPDGVQSTFGATHPIVQELLVFNGSIKLESQYYSTAGNVLSLFSAPGVPYVPSPSEKITLLYTDGSPSGGSGGHVIEDEGTPLPQRSSMNFVGAGVSVSDVGGKTVVTIPGGGGSSIAVDRSVATIAARNALNGSSTPPLTDQENVYVVDATGDSTVTSGWAIYKYLLATTSWIKIAEQESIDINLTSYLTKALAATDGDYAPSDADNTTGFWKALLTSGKLKIKSALDRLASYIGLLSGLTTTDKTTLVAAINEVNAKPGSSTGGYLPYNPGTTYSNNTSAPTTNIAIYTNRFWQWINGSAGSGVTPVEGASWTEVSPPGTSGTVYASQAEVNANPAIVSNKELNPVLLDGASGWWTNVKTRTGQYFTQVLGVLGLELGTSSVAGATRTIETKSSAADCAMILKTKGNTHIQFAGANYVISSGTKIMEMDASGNVKATYESTAAVVAAPATLSSAGVAGQIAYDGSFLYFCYSANNWAKVIPQSGALSFADLFIATPSGYTATGIQGQQSYDEPFFWEAIANNVWIKYQVKGARSFLTKTGTYTMLVGDWFVKCDASGGAFTVNLPTAVGYKDMEYVAKKIDSSGNTVTLDGAGSETIDGAATQSLSTQWQTMVLVSDGANWMIKSKF